MPHQARGQQKKAQGMPHQARGQQKSSQLVLLRHGQSEWNLKNVFTGWVDVPLSKAGKEEAHSAGKGIGNLGITFDAAYCSLLKRAIQTLWIVCEQLDQFDIPLHLHYAFNERHYGGLQGFDKAKIKEKYGAKQYHDWRRSYRSLPPPLQFSSEADYCKKHLYAPAKLKLLKQQELVDLPVHESLFDTGQRVLPFFQQTVLPRLRIGERILIVAHGNSLRALMKWLENIPDDEIETVELPTGQPVYYQLQTDSAFGKKKDRFVRL